MARLGFHQLSRSGILQFGASFGKEIEMEVVFGTPSQNCIGAGVCYLSKKFKDSAGVPCPHAPAIARWRQGRLYFFINESAIRHEGVAARLQGDRFEVLESFRLPLFMRRRLGIPFEWVRPGRYALRALPGQWVIDFGEGGSEIIH